jgi:hypothetical protein
MPNISTSGNLHSCDIVHGGLREFMKDPAYLALQRRFALLRRFEITMFLGPNDRFLPFVARITEAVVSTSTSGVDEYYPSWWAINHRQEG